MISKSDDECENGSSFLSEFQLYSQLDKMTRLGKKSSN